MFLIKNLILASIIVASCQRTSSQKAQITDTTSADRIAGSPIKYQSENLIIQQLSDHTYQRISYLNTESFGRVACNGMIVAKDNEAVVFDTPADDATSRELIDVKLFK